MHNNTCKTCKHWGEAPPQGPPRLEPEDKVRVCGLASDSSSDALDNAMTIAHRDDWACVITGPDFGCVRHELLGS